MDRLGRWLEAPESLTQLTRLARSVRAEMAARSIGLSPGDPFLFSDDGLAEIRSEMVLFILEKRTKLEKILVSGGPNGYRYLKSAFINHCIDKQRSGNTDPQRYLCRRATEVLRKSDRFCIFTGNGRKTAFAMTPRSRPAPPLTAEDMAEIEFPWFGETPLVMRHVARAAQLTVLAESFWKQVCRMWGGQAIRVDLRDFVSWLICHVAVEKPMRAASDRSGLRKTEAFFSDTGGDAGEIYFDAALVNQWAEAFSDLLTGPEKTAFYLRHGAQLPWQRIARMMGYKGCSGPKYPLDCAGRKLKAFLADRPWLSPGDLHPEAFSLFCETLFAILRTSGPML
ncbi:hypothetical protein [Desulfonema ishimotonii]|nr:hypothetical protein [Desulfonema ishimotonii]